MSPTAQQQLDIGLTHLYSLEYDESRAAFRRLIELEPDSPWGYLFESGGIWWQSAQEYGLFKDTPTLQGLFEQDVEAAIRKAELIIDSTHEKPPRADAHFILGMALGTRGQWELLRGHYVKAYLDGRKALKHLKKAKRLDDEYHDANLGLGVYDYQAARLSGVLKLAAIVGVRGDEERGIKRIKDAMINGRFARRQAAQFLSSIYLVDRRDYVAALPVIEGLRRDFPNSIYFKSLEALILHHLGRHDESIALGRDIFQIAHADPKAFERKLLSLVCGLAGEKCLEREDAQLLRDWTTYALAASPPTGALREPWLSTLHLYRGYAHDLLGAVDEAGRDFRWVLAHPGPAANKARAEYCLEELCDRPTLLAYLRELSKAGKNGQKSVSR